MPKPSLLAPFALALTLILATGPAADAASLTPPNLVAATSLNNPDLLLVWPYAAGGPLEQMSWSVFKGQMASGLSGSFLVPANNLSDVGNPTIARTNLGLPLGTSGANLCLLNSACTWSALQSFAASTTAGASLNIAPGVAPTSPNNGDMWTTSNGVFVEINGAAYGLATVQSGTYTPALTWVTPGTSSWGSVTAVGGWWRYGNPGAGFECHIYVSYAGTPTLGTASGNLEVSIPAGISINNNYAGAGIISYASGFRSLSGGMASTFWFGNSNFGINTFSATGISPVSTSNVTSGTALQFAVDIWAKC